MADKLPERWSEIFHENFQSLSSPFRRDLAHILAGEKVFPRAGHGEGEGEGEWCSL